MLYQVYSVFYWSFEQVGKCKFLDNVQYNIKSVLSMKKNMLQLVFISVNLFI